MPILFAYDKFISLVLLSRSRKLKKKGSTIQGSQEKYQHILYHILFLKYETSSSFVLFHHKRTISFWFLYSPLFFMSLIKKWFKYQFQCALVSQWTTVYLIYIKWTKFCFVIGKRIEHGTLWGECWFRFQPRKCKIAHGNSRWNVETEECGINIVWG